MSRLPILIIQMQRLGDLVLTFPLLGWLARLFPGHPLWVVGEERFFSQLMDLSPEAVYFPHSAAPRLRTQTFAAVINLSHRPEAAALAGSLRCEKLIGPYRTPEGGTHINGNWQLYRASLTHNNRYNRYHWADMNALDIAPQNLISGTKWPPPRQVGTSSSAHIGLFLGASETDKHPGAPFWGELAGHLLQAGHRPVLLGGEAERPLGAAVSNILKTHALNLTGHFTIRQLADFISGLDLFITPDTGPMHVAAWTGTPTLNLSTGPVNAWETGPFSPGHLVLRAELGCAGCWQCTRKRVLCKERLNARRTAFLAHECAVRGRENLARISLPGQELLMTGRDAHGLYHLRQLYGKTLLRHLTAELWQAFFGEQFTVLPGGTLDAAWGRFAAASGRGAADFTRSLALFSREMARSLSRNTDAALQKPDFWSAFPARIRPLTSYAQLLLQNETFGKPAFAKVLAMIESLVSLR